MKKILFIAAIFSIANCQFSLSRAQQPEAVYKLLRYEWTVNADGSSDYHYRHEVQILRNGALTAYADKGETFVVYNPDLEEVTINEVYTRRLDGSRVDMPQNAFVHQLPEECVDCGRFNHLRELAMVHTGMEIGCVIVVDYTVHRKYNLLRESLPLQRECPVEKLEVLVNYNHNDMDLRYTIDGFQYLPERCVTRDESVNTGNLNRSLHYTFTNLPQAPQEALMPADIIPTLHFYNAFPEHTPAFTREPFSGASRAVHSVMSGSDDKANVTAVRDFVVDNIHLNDIHPSHLGYVHATPEQVWQSGCGTAIDKAVFLAAVLNDLGFQARVIGDNSDEVGVMIDTIEYRLDVRHKLPIDINGKAKDEVEHFTLADTVDAAPLLDSLEDGFLSLNCFDKPYYRAVALPMERTTPLAAQAGVYSISRTYTLPKGVKMVGDAISRQLDFPGVGSLEISVKQKGTNLIVTRNITIEKSLIPVNEYAGYRTLTATWLSFNNHKVLLRSKK